MLKRLIDWKFAYFQLFLLVACLCILIVFDAQDILERILSKANVGDNELDMRFRIPFLLGRPIFSCEIIIAVLVFTWYINKERVLSSGFQNEIIWHSYAEYWVCRHILGYKKASLVRIPIPVQYKIVCAGLFLEYICDGTTEINEDSVIVTTTTGEDKSKITDTVNLVLADTYGIDSCKQITKDLLDLSTITIDRSGCDHARYYSQKFVSKVASVVRDLPKTVHTINVFATTNPKNNLHIAKEVFMTGGRDSIKHLYVFQQSSGEERLFDGKKLKIY